MENKFSVNEAAEKVMGRRQVNGIMLDQPSELGYICPVCKNKAYSNEHDIYDERLSFSEYNGFLWCCKCNKDYPSALCQPNIDKAIECFLITVYEAKINSPIKL